MYSSLKRKTPLKAKTPLKTKSTLKANMQLKTTSPSKASKPKKTKKPSVKYESIFTKDLNTCHITGSKKPEADIHIHHIFNGANKKYSEQYHFLVPLRADWHDMASYGIHFNKELDLKYRRACQEYWLKNYGTQEEFIKIFGRWW